MTRTERSRMIAAAMYDLRNDETTYVKLSPEEAYTLIKGARVDRHDIVDVERMFKD